MKAWERFQVFPSALKMLVCHQGLHQHRNPNVLNTEQRQVSMSFCIFATAQSKHSSWEKLFLYYSFQGKGIHSRYWNLLYFLNMISDNGCFAFKKSVQGLALEERAQIAGSVVGRKARSSCCLLVLHNILLLFCPFEKGEWAKSVLMSKGSIFWVWGLLVLFPYSIPMDSPVWK